MSKLKNSVARVKGGRFNFYPQFQLRYITSRGVAVWLPDGYEPGESLTVQNIRKLAG